MKSIKHLKIAGALQIVQGIPLLLFASWYVVLLIPDFRAGSMELGEIFTFILILAFGFLAGGIQVWFGISLAMQKQWTRRVGGFICCVPGFFSAPIVISVYTLWVLIQVNKQETKPTEPPLSP